MKKQLITFLMILIAAEFCHGQMPIGIKAGINLNSVVVHNLSPDFSDESSSFLGYHIGVFTAIKIGEKFKLVPEIQYILKGNKDKDSQPGSEEYTIKRSYLEIPVMASYSVVEKLSIEAGPSLGIKLGAKMVTDGGSSKMSEDYAEAIDFGVTGGLRFNITEKISVLGRYSYGLTPFVKLEQGNGYGTATFHNSNLQLSVAYRIK